MSNFLFVFRISYSWFLTFSPYSTQNWRQLILVSNNYSNWLFHSIASIIQPFPFGNFCCQRSICSFRLKFISLHPYRQPRGRGHYYERTCRFCAQIWLRIAGTKDWTIIFQRRRLLFSHHSMWVVLFLTFFRDFLIWCGNLFNCNSIRLVFAWVSKLNFLSQTGLRQWVAIKH